MDDDAPRPIRVLVADDEPLLRAGLRLILQQADDLIVTGEAGNGRDAAEPACAHDADVVLLDIRMAQMDGLAALEDLTVRTPASTANPAPHTPNGEAGAAACAGWAPTTTPGPASKPANASRHPHAVLTLAPFVVVCCPDHPGRRGAGPVMARAPTSDRGNMSRRPCVTVER
jgi:CheY-like chemotaxis protein